MYRHVCVCADAHVMMQSSAKLICFMSLLWSIVTSGVQIIEAAKKRGAEKAKLTKSMIVLDVKPWDDTTGELATCQHPIVR